MEYKPYTLEELRQMVAEGEQEFAEGKWQDSDEMLYELSNELHAEEQGRIAMVCE